MTIYFYLSIFIVTIFSYIFIESKKINIDKNEIFKFLSIILILISSLDGMLVEIGKLIYILTSGQI